MSVSSGSTAPGWILDRARALAAEALAAGVLEPIGAVRVAVDGFDVRILAGFDRKAPRTAGDPFLPPYEPLLLVDGAFGPDHAIVLNRYPVLDDHLLVVTRAWADQELPASPADLDALDRLLAEIDGLGFYNAGVAAGASQPHRHLQLVSRAALGPIPVEPAIRAAIAAGAGEVADWPFVHRIGARSAPIPSVSGPHTLLVTRGWWLVAPRTTGAVDG
ncbi:MAG: DUF4922 domain-containing protein, partial [Myxococcota bacterium]